MVNKLCYWETPSVCYGIANVGGRNTVWLGVYVSWDVDTVVYSPHTCSIETTPGSTIAGYLWLSTSVTEKHKFQGFTERSRLKQKQLRVLLKGYKHNPWHWRKSLENEAWSKFFESNPNQIFCAWETAKKSMKQAQTKKSVIENFLTQIVHE
jgi:hypothetical protein